MPLLRRFTLLFSTWTFTIQWSAFIWRYSLFPVVLVNDKVNQGLCSRSSVHRTGLMETLIGKAFMWQASVTQAIRNLQNISQSVTILTLQRRKLRQWDARSFSNGYTWIWLPGYSKAPVTDKSTFLYTAYTLTKQCRWNTKSGSALPMAKASNVLGLFTPS